MTVKQNSMLMVFLLMAIIAAAVTIAFSMWTLAINYKRFGDRRRELQLAEAGVSPIALSSDSSIRVPIRSMAARQANIEMFLCGLEARKN